MLDEHVDHPIDVGLHRDSRPLWGRGIEKRCCLTVEKLNYRRVGARWAFGVPEARSIGCELLKLVRGDPHRGIESTGRCRDHRLKKPHVDALGKIVDSI